jgi:hypothetical protein
MEGICQSAYAATGAWAVEQPSDTKSEPDKKVTTKFSKILATIYYFSGIAHNAVALVSGGSAFPLEMLTGDIKELEAGETNNFGDDADEAG